MKESVIIESGIVKEPMAVVTSECPVYGGKRFLFEQCLTCSFKTEAENGCRYAVRMYGPKDIKITGGLMVDADPHAPPSFKPRCMRRLGPDRWTIRCASGDRGNVIITCGDFSLPVKGNYGNCNKCGLLHVYLGFERGKRRPHVKHKFAVPAPKR